MTHPGSWTATRFRGGSAAAGRPRGRERVLFLPARLRAALEREARAAHPREACGVLLGRRLPHAFRLHAVLPGQNLHPQPHRFFELDPGLVVVAACEARRRGLDLLGFFHSHPAGPPVPSETDRACAWEQHLALILGRVHAETRAAPDSPRAHRLGAYRTSRGGWSRLGILCILG